MILTENSDFWPKNSSFWLKIWFWRFLSPKMGVSTENYQKTLFSQWFLTLKTTISSQKLLETSCFRGSFGSKFHDFLNYGVRKWIFSTKNPGKSHFKSEFWLEKSKFLVKNYLKIIFWGSIGSTFLWFWPKNPLFWLKISWFLRVWSQKMDFSTGTHEKLFFFLFFSDFLPEKPEFSVENCLKIMFSMFFWLKIAWFSQFWSQKMDFSTELSGKSRFSARNYEKSCSPGSFSSEFPWFLTKLPIFLAQNFSISPS